MGYMCHHAVLVTSWDSDAIERIHALAGELLEEWRAHDSGLSAAILSPISGEATHPRFRLRDERQGGGTTERER